jgi:hypothetical protein
MASVRVAGELIESAKSLLGPWFMMVYGFVLSYRNQKLATKFGEFERWRFLR